MSAVQSFDAQGRLDSEIVVYEDGRYILIDYEQARAGAWSFSSRTYDVSHRLVEDALLFDSGAQHYTYYDASGAYPWASQIVRYDPAGQVELLRTSYDTSRVEQVAYDTQNRQPWATVRDVFTEGPSGFPDIAPRSSDVLLDDGSLIAHRYSTESYGGGFYARRYSTTTFDANGRPDFAAERFTTFTIGLGEATRATDYDSRGEHAWDRIVVERDPQGRQTSYYALFDDGAQDWSYFDVAGVQPWSAASSHKEFGSNRVDWTALLDDGSVISGFDLV